MVVLSGGVELRSGAACSQAERRERLRCCPPTYFDVAFDASGVRLKRSSVQFLDGLVVLAKIS